MTLNVEQTIKKHEDDRKLKLDKIRADAKAKKESKFSEFQKKLYETTSAKGKISESTWSKQVDKMKEKRKEEEAKRLDELDNKIDEAERTIKREEETNKPLSEEANKLTLEARLDALDERYAEISGRIKTDTPKGYESDVSHNSEFPRDWAFGVDVFGKAITIQGGPIYVQGVKRVDLVKSTSLEAMGEYCWVIVKIPISNIELSSFDVVASIPSSDTTYVYVPLVRLKCLNYLTTADYYCYDGDGAILKRGLINLSNPLVFE